jgi:hypothetical protein
MLVLILLNYYTTSALKVNPNPREKTSGFLLSTLTGRKYKTTVEKYLAIIIISTNFSSGCLASGFARMF